MAFSLHGLIDHFPHDLFFLAAADVQLHAVVQNDAETFDAAHPGQIDEEALVDAAEALVFQLFFQMIEAFIKSIFAADAIEDDLAVAALKAADLPEGQSLADGAHLIGKHAFAFLLEL